MVGPFVQINRAITQLKVTVEGQEDIWRDIYRVQNLPAIVAGSVIRVTLAKQIENQPYLPDGTPFDKSVAFLRHFYIGEPDGSEVQISLGNRTDVVHDLGLNITRAGHYESGTEGCVYIVPADIPTGSKIAYRARAKTSTVQGAYLKIWDKGCLTVEITEPCALQAQIDDLKAIVAGLVARYESGS
jgi:hypothetical protein